MALHELLPRREREDDFYDRKLIGQSVERTIDVTIKLGMFELDTFEVIYELVIDGPDTVHTRDLRIKEERVMLVDGRYIVKRFEHSVDAFADKFPDIVREIRRACEDDASSLTISEIDELVRA